MWLFDILRDFTKYAKTSDYLHGVYVALTQILIEVLLFSLIASITIYIYHRIRTRHLRSVLIISLFQVFHKVTTLYLEIASVTDLIDILFEERKRNPDFKIYSNYFYGNLENKLFVLNKVFQEGLFEREFKKKTLSDFERYGKMAENCLSEIDWLTLVTIMFPKKQEEFIKMRLSLWVLRDQLLQIEKKFEQQKPDFDYYAYKFKEGGQLTTKAIEEIFMRERKLIDSVWKHRRWIRNAGLIKRFFSLATLSRSKRIWTSWKKREQKK
jgi:hypothetical protein